MKTVLITGANKGIGFETAKQLLNLNYRVIVTARNRLRGESALRKLKEYGSEAVFIQMDVSREESIISASEEFGRMNIGLDTLINNAAVLLDKSSILNVSANTFIETITTNTLGPLLTIKYFSPLMNSGGRIINVSSGLGSLSSMSDYAPLYSISKAALNAITKQFSFALGAKKISVNSTCPGWVRTDMGGPGATRSLQKGAETIIWLADEAPQNITGKFFRDKKEIDW